MRNAIILFIAVALAVLANACQKTSPSDHDHDHGQVSSAPSDQGRTVPPAVAAALERRSPGARITKFHTHAHAGEPERWHLHYTTADGKEEEASFDSTGQPAAE